MEFNCSGSCSLRIPAARFGLHLRQESPFNGPIFREPHEPRRVYGLPAQMLVNLSGRKILRALAEPLSLFNAATSVAEEPCSPRAVGGGPRSGYFSLIFSLIINSTLSHLSV